MSKFLKKIFSSSLFWILFFLSIFFTIWFTIFWTEILPSQGTIVGGDPADYAQIARNVFQGKGFITNVAFAAPLDFYKERGLLLSSWPDVWRDPFLTSSIAFFYKIFGVKDFVIVITSEIYAILTTIMIFYASRRMSNLKTAILTTIFWITLPGTIFFAFRGYKELPATFLVATMIFCLTIKKKWLSFFFLGLTVGAYYLLKSSLAFPFLIAFSFFILLKLRSKKLFIVFFLSFLFTTLPWFIRNYKIAGDPFFSIVKNCTIPANQITHPNTPQDMCGQFPKVEILPFIKSHPREMLIKYVFGVKTLLSTLPLGNIPAFPVYLFSFFWLGFFLRGEKKIYSYRVLFLSAALIQIVLQPISSFVSSQFFPSSPVFLVFGCLTLVEITKKMQKTERYLVLGFVIFLSLVQSISHSQENFKISKPFSTRFQTPNEGLYQTMLSNDIKIIEENTSAGDIVVASFPFEVAYYSQRKTIQVLPENQAYDQYRRLSREYLPFNAIFLSWRHLHGPWPEPWWDKNNLENFKLVQKMPSGSILLKKIEYPSNNLIPSFDSEKKKVIPISLGKNYLFSTWIFSSKDYKNNTPLTVLFKYLTRKGDYLLTQEINNTDLRKNRLNYLSEKLLLPKNAYYVEISFKELLPEAKDLTIKDTLLREVYWEKGI